MRRHMIQCARGGTLLSSHFLLADIDANTLLHINLDLHLFITMLMVG